MTIPWNTFFSWKTVFSLEVYIFQRAIVVKRFNQSLDKSYQSWSFMIHRRKIRHFFPQLNRLFLENWINSFSRYFWVTQEKRTSVRKKIFEKTYILLKSFWLQTVEIILKFPPRAHIFVEFLGFRLFTISRNMNEQWAVIEIQWFFDEPKVLNQRL